MRLLAKDALRIEPVGPGRPEWSKVAIGDLSGTVEGLVVEAVVEFDETDPIAGYLFFLTHDTPFEEALSITLTDRSLRPLDYARLGGAYATGVWHDPTIEGPGAISFRFIDRKRWRLSVSAAPRFNLPFLTEPTGIHRRFGFTRRFDLSAESLPGTA